MRERTRLKSEKEGKILHRGSGSRPASPTSQSAITWFWGEAIQPNLRCRQCLGRRQNKIVFPGERTLFDPEHTGASLYKKKVGRYYATRKKKKDLLTAKRKKKSRRDPLTLHRQCPIPPNRPTGSNKETPRNFENKVGKQGGEPPPKLTKDLELTTHNKEGQTRRQRRKERASDKSSWPGKAANLRPHRPLSEKDSSVKIERGAHRKKRNLFKKKKDRKPKLQRNSI